LSAIASIGATKISQTLANEALHVERSQLADRIEESTADLVAANRQLAQANRLKDEFLASMSHELRTPLNVVLGMSEALTEGVYGLLSDEQVEGVSHIHESGTHLLSLINDILDLSKIAAGKVNLDLHPCSIHETCASAVRMIRRKAESKRLTLAFQDETAATMAVLDGRRVKQVLLNLLSNAVKFTPKGGEIGLRVSLTRESDKELINFEVWDSGIGIPETEIKNLFVPFQQIDSGLARAHEGTGLGLVITKRLVELHGGTIHLESDEGHGTRVTLKFPLINHA
jgi:signal transduction histidine kinase